MREARKIEGRWWICGANDEPHLGVLTYEPETGLKLEVKIARPVDRDTGEAVMGADRICVPDTVVGSDEHGRKITVFGCGVPGSKSSAGLLTIRVRPLTALLGKEFTSWEEARFLYARAEFSLLHNWTGRSRLSVQHADDGKGFESQVFIAKPEPINIDLDGGARMVLLPTLSVLHSAEGVRCREGHCVELSLSQEQKVEDIYNNYIVRLRRLLTLFTGRPVFDDKIGFLSKPGSYDEIELLWTNTGAAAADRSVLHPQMLVSFRDISSRVGDVVRRWYRIHEQLEDTLNLYFSTIFSPSVYSHQQFLFLAQAIEVYHRSNPTFDNAVQPRARFRTRIKRIIAAVPNESDWLKSKLAFANEKTLAQRISEILEARKSESSKFIENRKEFTERVRATRNHFTHYSTGKHRMDQVATGVDLMKITDQLRTLLVICIFSDLGVTGPPIERLLAELKTRRYFSL